MGMKRRKPKPVASCQRCGNEEDLRAWLNGMIYCRTCILCEHVMHLPTNACTDCLRMLHTVLTFEGPRIIDMAYYIKQAWREYGVPAGGLSVWTFEEEEAFEEAVKTVMPGDFTTVTAPPPHHRF